MARSVSTAKRATSTQTPLGAAKNASGAWMGMRPLAWRCVSESCRARDMSYSNRAPIHALTSSALRHSFSASP